MSALDADDDLAGEEEMAKAPPLTPEEIARQFIEACKQGRLPAVRELLEKGATVAARDDRKWSPLLWASFGGHHEVVDLLLEHGAAEDWRAENGLGESALEASGGTEDAAGYTLGSGAAATKRAPVNSPLNWAVFEGHVRVVWSLLRANFSVSDFDDRGNTALHLAAMRGDPEILRAIMGAGVQIRQLNAYGNTALSLAASPEARRLLKAAMEQRTCPATNVEFGPHEPQYLCYSTDMCFSEEGSNAVLVPAFPDDPNALKLVRLSNDAEYRMQDAETALETALNPHGSATDVAGTDAALADVLADVEIVEEAEVLAGAVRPGSFTGGVAAAGGGGRAGGVPSLASRSRGPSGSPLGANAIEEEDDEEDEDEDEDEDDEDDDEEAGVGEEDDEEEGAGGGGATAGGAGGKRRSGKGRGKGKGKGKGRAKEDGDGLSGGGEPGEASEPEPELELEDLPPLESALALVKSLRGNVRLIARGERAVARLQAWARLQDAVARLEGRRPLRDRSEVAELSSAIVHAKSVGLGARRIAMADDAAQRAVAECRLVGVIQVCKTITRATHAYDGDLLRLQKAVADAQRYPGIAASVFDQASVLLARLEGEVSLGDAEQYARAAGRAAEAATVDHREEDPTLLPRPETPPPPPEPAPAPVSARGGGRGAASKPTTPSTTPRGAPAGRGRGAAAAAPPPPPPEPLPPLYPTPQLEAINALQLSVEMLGRAIERARAAGGDPAVIAQTEASRAELVARRQQLWDEEIARIRVYEAERIKREKKKKGGKKKKK